MPMLAVVVFLTYGIHCVLSNDPGSQATADKAVRMDKKESDQMSLETGSSSMLHADQSHCQVWSLNPVITRYCWVVSSLGYATYWYLYGSISHCALFSAYRVQIQYRFGQPYAAYFRGAKRDAQMLAWQVPLRSGLEVCRLTPSPLDPPFPSPSAQVHGYFSLKVTCGDKHKRCP